MRSICRQTILSEKPYIEDGLFSWTIKKWADQKSYDDKRSRGAVERVVCQEINLKSDFVVIERELGPLSIQVHTVCVLQ